MESNKLKQELEQFTGTEKYHKLTIFNLLATDGVAFFVDKAEAFWLIDDIACIKDLNLKNENFIVVKAISKNNIGNVIYEDGNYNKLHEMKYDYTDLPEGEWKFFIQNNVIMLPSEY